MSSHTNDQRAGQISFPRDFLEEVEGELHDAQRRLGCDHDRVAQLQSLYRVSVAVAARLGRQITVFDVIRSAEDRAERERREQLVRALRSPHPSQRNQSREQGRGR
jgi:hypothetical protein